MMSFCKKSAIQDVDIQLEDLDIEVFNRMAEEDFNP